MTSSRADDPADEPNARFERLRLRDLLIIERVHALGSLRQVADSMHLTQPAVTQALQTLEEAFDAQLVVRSSGGAVLTATGVAVLHRLRAMRREAMAARAAARRPRHPTVTLGLNQLAAGQFAPAAIAAFLAAHPDVRLDVEERNSPALWQRLKHGQVDAIVCRMPAAEQFEELSDAVAHDVLGLQRMVVVAAEDHPLVGRGPLAKAQLADQAWALPPADSYARQTLNEWFLRADVPLPAATVTSASFHTNVRLVAASRLLTLVPESTLAELRKALGLGVVPVETDWDGFAYFFACRRSSLMNPLVRSLRDHFARFARHERDRDRFC